MAGLTDVSPYTALAARYGRAFDFAVVFVVAAWQVAGEGTQLVADRAAYSSDSVQVAAWSVLTLAVVVGAFRLLGPGRAPLAGPARPSGSTAAGPAPWSMRTWPWALAGAGVVISAVVAAACPPDALLKTDWAWGSAGWIAVLALLRRPMRELCGFLALDALVTFTLLAKDGLDRLAVAGFLTVLVGSASIQLAVTAAAHALNSVARRAADAARVQAATRETAAIAELVDAARRTRMNALLQTAGPLIRALAAGSADPGDATVRRACAVEAARLRRLMAESDDSAAPLLHELHASAESAVRSGVVVDLEVAGELPDIPAEVRRTITDTAIAVLATCRSRARITVTAAEDSVAVGLLADSPAEEPLPPGAATDSPLVIDIQRDNLDLWLEARWTVR
jgi:hypothetical protein